MRTIGLSTLLLLQAVLVLIAVWQILGLLPALSWLGSPSAVPAGLWVAAGFKAVMLAIAVLLGWGCWWLRRRVRGVRPSPP